MTAAYMNRDDVKKALHVDKSPTKQWPGPPDNWSYHGDYDACNGNVPTGAWSMIDFYREIAGAKYCHRLGAISCGLAPLKCL
jgi:hypothetical protein